MKATGRRAASVDAPWNMHLSVNSVTGAFRRTSLQVIV